MSAQFEPTDNVDNADNVGSSTPPSASAPSAALPEIPTSTLDFDVSAFIGPIRDVEDKVRKRASNLMKLTEENEKLKAELKAVSDRLEAAERRREEIEKEQKLEERAR
ncbi:hypothetical protein AX17_003446 [Amanita inopinata Kibby_2008]|nr:hypothetical protein AX17_003446 [Amanita inopinata Kibby_2008]